MNGLLPDGHYFTIHITPEPEFSYVSFETNVPYSQYNEIIRKVINMFNPGKFTTTIFGGTVSDLSWKNLRIRSFLSQAATSLDIHRKLFLYSDFDRIDHQIVCLVDYDLIYSYYKKHPS